MKKKIVLITGAAGMVGSNLIRRYIKKKFSYSRYR